MSSTEKKTLEILLENIFLQKELMSKEEILNTLIKTQATILESVSYQKSKNWIKWIGKSTEIGSSIH